jgi:hypothetical protein
MTDLNTLTPPGSLYLGRVLSPSMIVAGSWATHVSFSNRAFNSETQLAFLATPCDGEGDCEAGLSPSRKVILPDNVRGQLRQQHGFGRFGTGLMRP